VTTTDGPPGHIETHSTGTARRTNWLRAGVLGANDGILSIAGLVVGVAGATQSRTALLVAGLAGLVAGALSMGVGEYVSVSTQRDTERALLDREKRELESQPDQELEELTRIHESKGLAEDTARGVAAQLTAQDALQAHARDELGFDPLHLASPWSAAAASIVSFVVGAMLPLLAVLLPPAGYRLWVTVAAVLISLTVTGLVSAHLGEAPGRRAAVRVVAGGAIVMAITYGIGRLVGTWS
jgi:vacuolar iron transporter family protein